MQHNHQPEKYTAVAERHENAKSSSDRLGGVGVFHLPRLVPPYGSRSLDGANISLNSASTRSDGPGPPEFDAAEHKWLGDNTLLETGIAGSKRYLAGTKVFILPNKVKLTYGEISLLAGDFFGTSNPISDGKDDADRTKRFQDAWETLAEYERSDAMDVLKVLQPEVDAVNQAVKEHRDPSEAYSKLPNVDWALEYATNRWWKPGFPTYFQLASYNWDHFGEDAYICYKVGHVSAMNYARANRDPDGLNRAYAMNAFADHFLQDIFSAGHVRTPRRLLHETWYPYYPDMCAKSMHDEDCAIGLSVQDSSGKSWTMYGDKRLLDRDNLSNLTRCQQAVQASADEIYEAWKPTSTTQQEPGFKALDFAPKPHSALGTDQKLAPLFRVSGGTVERRANIKNRKDYEFTSSWHYKGTYDECEESGWWKYPMSIDGPSELKKGAN